MNRGRLHAIVLLAVQYLCKAKRIKKRRFYFCSFHGQYSDSPRNISEMLYLLFPDAEFVWEISDKCHENLPTYIKPVRPFSIKSIRLRSSSEVIIDNYLGYLWGYCDQNSFAYKILKNAKKKGQFNLCTWHGTPFKKIGIDEPKNIDKKLAFYSSSDCVVCNSRFLSSTIIRISKNVIEPMIIGSPRNDRLFSIPESGIIECKEKMGLPPDKKIVLYAPTFRDSNIQMSGIRQIKDLNIEGFLSILSEKFGGDWIFVFRAHDSVVREIEKEHIEIPKVYSGNTRDDMAEYLIVSDVLLTDYSGCFFDYALTKKPCFLYCPDLDHYRNNERGFYFDINELPFSCSTNQDELLQNISSFNYEDYLNKLNFFQHSIGNVDDGNSTKRAVQLIKDRIC